MLRIFEGENEKGPQPPDSFPVTIDVTALYTNIPAEGQDGGLAAFEKAMNKRTDKTVPTSFLIDLMKIVLGCNVFEFNSKLYIQRIGTAMGSRCAPTYACLFMAELENRMLETWTGTQPWLYKRFIDDCFMIWTGSVQELEEFIEYINSRHKFIKFTAEYNPTTRTVPFLDMQVSINNSGKIVTSLYTKECARIQYLLPSSCHPSHCSANIPYSLGYRLLRLCSERETFFIRA